VATFTIIPKISDLHLVRVGNREYAVVLTVVSENPQSPDYYKDLIRFHEELVHISVDVNTCPGHAGSNAELALR
jgi:hypothetical protein